MRSDVTTAPASAPFARLLQVARGRMGRAGVEQDRAVELDQPPVRALGRHEGLQLPARHLQVPQRLLGVARRAHEQAELGVNLGLNGRQSGALLRVAAGAELVELAQELLELVGRLRLRALLDGAPNLYEPLEKPLDLVEEVVGLNHSLLSPHSDAKSQARRRCSAPPASPLRRHLGLRDPPCLIMLRSQFGLNWSRLSFA
jgi:hypothetical protein